MLVARIASDTGQHEDAEELLSQAETLLGAKLHQTFSAARELRRAAELRETQRPLGSLTHLLLALVRSPSFAAVQMLGWAHDRGLGSGT